MRIVAVLVAMAFAVTLAIVVANRLSNEAMAVIVGAVCGISATIPISLGFAIAASRNWGQRQTPSPYDTYEQPRAPQPPVIVIAPPQQQPSPYAPYGAAQQSYYLPPSAPPPGAPRDFKIVGDE